MADKTASGSGGSSAQDSSKKVGLIGLVGIVISAMIGGGIYNLPQNMAADASAGAIIIAWVVTGIGIWFIANTFRILSAARPELTNGLYTYAEKGFGKLIGFFVAYGYWICNCFALVAYSVPVSYTHLDVYKRQAWPSSTTTAASATSLTTKTSCSTNAAPTWPTASTDWI